MSMHAIEPLEQRMVLAAPTAQITADASLAYGSDTFADGSMSFDNDMMGTIVSYQWDLDGDGDYDDATGSTVSLYWSAILTNGGTPGNNYNVGLKVTDDDGDTDTESCAIALGTSSNPCASISGTASLEFGMDTFLDASMSSDGDEMGMSIQTYEWDLDGDGDYDDATGSTVSLYWSAILTNGGTPGNNYNVGLKVTDNEGETDTEVFAIALGEPADPVAEFFDTDPVPYGNSFSLDGSLSYDQDEMGMSIQTYEWDLDNDGIFDVTGQQINVTWNDIINVYCVTPGSNMPVTLRVTDNEGDTDEETKNVFIEMQYKLIIKVDQPGAGGDRDYIEGIDVGHAFLTLVKGDGTEKSYGFYPGAAGFWGNGPGIVIDNDTSHTAEVSKTYIISNCDYEYLLGLINTDIAFPPNYTLFGGFNCVDWVLSISSGIGINITTVNRSMSYGIFSGTGHNPGDFGEDLRALP